MIRENRRPLIEIPVTMCPSPLVDYHTIPIFKLIIPQVSSVQFPVSSFQFPAFTWNNTSEPQLGGLSPRYLISDVGLNARDFFLPFAEMVFQVIDILTCSLWMSESLSVAQTSSCKWSWWNDSLKRIFTVIKCCHFHPIHDIATVEISFENHTLTDKKNIFLITKMMTHWQRLGVLTWTL